MLIWLIVVMVVACLASAVALSLVIRSLEQGAIIMSVFMVATLIGVLGVKGSFGTTFGLVAFACSIGCIGAFGTFRIWTGATPVARAVGTVAGLAVIMACLATAMYLDITT